MTKDISVLKNQFEKKLLNQSGLLSLNLKFLFVMLMNKVFKMVIIIQKTFIENTEKKIL